MWLNRPGPENLNTFLKEHYALLKTKQILFPLVLEKYKPHRPSRNIFCYIQKITFEFHPITLAVTRPITTMND